ncbi:ABC transporter substrate-binding protein [Mammaliicoccus sp. JADD-157]|uniref:ABC transporter substrate-binding protein n=1 Tax=Mammaliicoccus sp. JADD-157 TaxID=3404818 RepID=UPI003BB55F52
MKRYLFLFMACLVFLLAACGNNDSKDSKDSSDSKEVTYTDQDGNKIKVPNKPKRIVDLTASYGNFKKLGVEPIAITNVYPDSKFLKQDDIKKVDPEDPEAVAKLKPDLIIAYAENKNINKLKKIAPTVSFRVKDLTYKDMHEDIGKLVGKEDDAKQQIKDLDKKMKDDGKEVKEKLGEDNTYTIMDIQPKLMYLFGPGFGRGSDVIYNGYGLKQDSDAKKDIPKERYMEVSQEDFQKYTGDYLLVPTQDGKAPNNAFTKSNVWKNTDAIKNDHVIYYSINEFLYSDPISLETQSDFFKKELLNK